MVEPRSAEPYFPRWRLGCGGAPGPFSSSRAAARAAHRRSTGRQRVWREPRRGLPVTDVSAQLGHARKSMTLDTYSHVLLSG
jgi:integrase